MRISIATLLALSFGTSFVFCADRVRQIQEEHRRLERDLRDYAAVVAAVSNQDEDVDPGAEKGPEEEVDSDEEGMVQAARFTAALRVQVKTESVRIVEMNEKEG